MPITLRPIDRRQFLKGSGALAGGQMISLNALARTENEPRALDPNRVALLADTHISADPEFIYPGTKWPGSPVKDSDHETVNMADCLTQTANEVIALHPRPAHVIVNGDCAFSKGLETEYHEFFKLIEPMRVAGITVHVTVGNHDNRENIWKLLPFLKKEQMGIQADVIELPHANLVLLDSGRRGILGDRQLTWLAKQLDQRDKVPALIFGHFNPYPNRGVRPIQGMRDGPSLLKLLGERPHAKAYFYGHTHEWQHDLKGQLHLINQPAVSYYFGKGHANGWIDMSLTETTATIQLHCINADHTQNGDRRQISLEEKLIH